MVATCLDVAKACAAIDCELLSALCGHMDAIKAVTRNYNCDESLLVALCAQGFHLTVGGPGTELKKLLAAWPLYITASPDCSCNARAAEMDRREQETPGWCEANLDLIVGWLREQAEARGLPFLDVAGRMLVRRAIRNARRNA